MHNSLTERNSSLRRWRHARDIFAVLFSRDIKIDYNRSFLGAGWTLAGPLLRFIVFLTVFRRVLAGQIENYPAYVFSGVLVWGWFQSSLAQSTGIITGSRALVRQPGFPLALLPLVTVGVRLFHFMVALPLLIALLCWHGIYPAWSWTALPAVLAAQFILTVGLAYPLASLNVKVRDTQHIIGALLQLAMFLTPVFYSLQSVPERIRPFYYLNPLVGLMEAWRDILLRGRWPDPLVLGGTFALGAVLLMLGRKIFVSQSHRFVEEL